MQDYHQLQVWPKSHQLTLRVYRATASFPKAEVFGLTSPIRRAVVAVVDLSSRSFSEWLSAATEVKRMLTGLLKRLKLTTEN